MIPLNNPPVCAYCYHPADLHIPGVDQCGYRLNGEHRCTCPGYQEVLS